MICAEQKKPLFEEFPRYEWKREQAGNYRCAEGNGGTRIVHSGLGQAKGPSMSYLRQVGKPHDQRKNAANFPATPESEQSLHSPGAAARTALRSWGIPHNPPDVLEHACDDEGKTAWPPFDDDGRSFSCQPPHSMLRIRKPLLCWRRAAPLRQQSPLACEAT